MVKEKQNLNQDQGADLVPIHLWNTSLQSLTQNLHRKEKRPDLDQDRIQNPTRAPDPAHKIKIRTLFT